MAKIYKSTVELIGNTPLVELTHIEKKYSLKAKLLVKLEYFNPTGSVKDRIAKKMIDDAEASGALKSGATIIEPTSGNTGIGLAAIGTAKGYKVIIVIPGQFVNSANPKVHYETTGPEIFSDTNGEIDIFVAGVGTGGTITGTGKYLKEKKSEVKIVAVEPAASPVLSKGVAGGHKIQGIGAGFVPDVLDTKIYDEIIPVENDTAFEIAKEVSQTEGILLGISSGAAIAAAIEEAKKDENNNKTIVAICPDGGDRYFSTLLFG